MDLDASFRTPPRVKPFFQGCALMVLLALLSVVPYWAVLAFSTEPGSWIWAPALGGAIAVGVALRLVSRWWRPARWRAYGLLAALLAPLALVLVLILWLVIATPQLYPR